MELPQDNPNPMPLRPSLRDRLAQRRKEREALRSQPQEPQEESRLKGNPLSNFVEGAWNTTKGLADFAFRQAPTQIGEAVKDPAGWARDIGYFFSDQHGAKEARDIMYEGTIGRSAITSLIQGKPDEFFERIHNEPFDFVLDLSVVGGLAGGTAARAGNMAQRSARLAKLGVKLEQMGTRIAQASAAIDPIRQGGRLVGKVAKPVLESLGVGPHSKPLLQLRQHEYAADALEEQASLQRIMKVGLTPEEGARLDRAIRVGAADDFAALSPAAMERYKIWKDIVTEGAETAAQEATLQGRRLVTERQGFLANAKAAASYLFEDGPTRANVRKAAQLMKEGKIKPTFASMYGIETGAKDLFTTFSDDVKRLGHAARLEKRTGFGQFEKNPDIYMVRQVKAFHAFNKRLRWMDRTMQYLKKNNLIKAVPGGGDPPKGYAFLQDGIFRKYYSDQARAGSILVDEIMKGAPPERAVEMAYQRLLRDPEIVRGLKDAQHIAVPRHVAELVAREFQLPGAIGRIYDRGTSYWKAMATIFSPRYWLSTAIGNGFLAVLFGVGPGDVRLSRKYRESLPAPVRARLETEIALPEMSAYERVAQKFGQYASVLDEAMLRRPLYIKSVRESYNRLKGAGADFFGTAENFEEFLRKTAVSPEELSRIERKLQAVEETASLRSVEIKQLQRDIEAAYKTLNDIGSRAATQQSREYAARHNVAAEVFGKERQNAAALEQFAAEGKAFKAEGRQKLGQEQARIGAKAEGIGQEASKAQARLRKLEETYGKLSKDHPLVMDAAYPEIQKIIVPAFEAEVKEALRKIPGHQAKSPQILREIRGEVRRTILERKNKEIVRKIEEIKEGILPKVKARLEKEILKETELFERLVKSGKKAATVEPSISLGRAPSKPELVSTKPRRIPENQGLQKLESQVYAARQKVAELEYAIKAKKADLIDQLNQSGQLRRMVPELEKYAKVSDDAVELTNRAAGSYTNLHPIERDWFRRAVPFYAFTKAMTLLAFRLPYLRPKTTFMWHHMDQMLVDLMNDDRNPPWVRAYTPLAITEDGGIIGMRLMSANPFNSVRASEVGGLKVPRITNVFQQNPLVKFAYELHGGTPQWSGKPLSPGEGAVRIDNGEVWQYTGNGFRKTIATPSIMKSLWYLFPQAQLVDELWLRSAQTDRGWIGHPEPIRDRTGKVMFPKELMTILGSAFIPIQKIDLKAEQQKDLQRRMRIIRSVQEEARRAPPERRKEMLQILAEWAKNPGGIPIED